MWDVELKKDEKFIHEAQRTVLESRVVKRKFVLGVGWAGVVVVVAQSRVSEPR